MQRKSMLSAAPGEGSMLYDDADMGGAGRFDSLGMTAEDAGGTDKLQKCDPILEAAARLTSIACKPRLSLIRRA
jgi:hypothetical protein